MQDGSQHAAPRNFFWGGLLIFSPFHSFSCLPIFQPLLRLTFLKLVCFYDETDSSVCSSFAHSVHKNSVSVTCLSPKTPVIGVEGERKRRPASRLQETHDLVEEANLDGLIVIYTRKSIGHSLTHVLGKYIY